MRLKDAGLGIKTSNPTHALDVSGSISMLSGSENQLLLPQSNGATSPTIAFGDGDTGFYEASDDSMWYASAGVARWKSDSTYLLSTVTGDKPTIVNEIATSTNPVFTFYGDTDTGIGLAGADTGSLIAGGVNVLNWNSDGYVGIGTVTPQYNFQIRATSTPTLQIVESGNHGMTIGMAGTGAGEHSLFNTDSQGGFAFTGGYVGIGTINPSSQLHIFEGSTATSLAYTDRGLAISSDTYPRIVLEETNGTVNSRVVGMYNNAGQLIFRTLRDDAGAVQRNIMAMELVNGYVGIGTIEPQSELHV
jgi:hypothetical protein